MTLILSTFCMGGLFFNILLLWYIKKLLGQFHLAAEDATTIAQEIEDYRAHLQTVYELETYYGDATIKGVLQHTGDFLEKIKGYQEIFSTVIEPVVVDETDTPTEEGPNEEG
tara:strand:+ start:11348 stop:11683 length:336 start_codon:yes stop_codon:yes gene_type:complete